MFNLSVFEAGMLICFGAAWPMNIIKSLRSRTSAGKSVLFQWFVLIGYISGITHKILNSRDIVMVLYIINFLMIAFDTYLYYRNKKLDERRANGELV
jgi:hypothetical protein